MGGKEYLWNGRNVMNIKVRSLAYLYFGVVLGAGVQAARHARKGSKHAATRE